MSNNNGSNTDFYSDNEIDETDEIDYNGPNGSNFTKVLNFMSEFGQTVYTEPNPSSILNKNLTKLRCDLIEEELNELKDAIKNNDYVEVIDALADILYVTYGAGGAFGINLDKAFDLVHKSNMTKLCVSEEEAVLTVANYLAQESQRYAEPVYRQSDNKKYWIVYDKKTGKVLKSINYKPVDLKSL